MGAPTIATLNSFQPISQATMADGTKLIANGVDRPRRWDGLTASAQNAGIDAPDNPPTITTPTSGGATLGDYYLGYRWIDDDEIPNPGNLTDLRTATAAALDRFTWNGLQAPSDSRIAAVQLYRSTMGQAEEVYRVATLGVSGSVTSIGDSGGFCVITFPAAHRLTIGARITLTGTSVGGYNTTHQVTAVGSSTTVVTDVAYSSNATGGTWATSGFDNDIATDTQLFAPTVTSIGNSGGFCAVTVTVHNLTIGEKFVIAGSDQPTYNVVHTVTAITSATVVVTNIAYVANSTAAMTWSVLLWYPGAFDPARLPLNGPDGGLYARRNTVPPDHKAVVFSFGDRSWWAVDVEYTRGTVTTNGTTTVTGTGTDWTSQMVGRRLTIAGQTTSYEIESVASATSLTTKTAVTTATNSAYAIRPPKSERGRVYWSELGFPESVPATNAQDLLEQGADQSELSGFFALRGFLYVAKQRELLRFSYVEDPTWGEGYPVAQRGMFNQRCWVYAEEAIYLMDQQGMWKFTGRGAEIIGAPLQNYFRDATIDFTKSKWFFVSYNPEQELIRYHVAFVGDSGTRPRNAFAYQMRTGRWNLDQYPWELGGSAILEVSGRVRMLLGGQDDVVHLADDGLADGITTAVTGMVTSAGAATLIDSSANFTSAAVGCPVAIISGTGKRQTLLRVLTRDSATQLTLDGNWATVPDTTSRYLIGAIPWRFKTGLLKFDMDKRSDENSARISFQPTDNPAWLDIRRYLNHSTSPEDNQIDTEGPGAGASIKTAAGDPDAVVSLASEQEPDLAPAEGYVRYGFSDGLADDRSIIDRWLALELRGYQGLDQITIYGLEIPGVEG